MGRHKVLNTPSIRRMPTYLHKLMLLVQSGEEFVSTSSIARYFSLDPIIVRKDFELTGLKGMPGVGYKTADLVQAMRNYLGWNEKKKTCLIGAGSLGSALLGYAEFTEYGMEICDVFDSDPEKIGKVSHGYIIEDIAKMTELIREHRPRIAVLCVPASVAQKVATVLVESGIKAIWNFANVCLDVPPDVVVQREVIAGGFALLSMKLKLHGAPLE